MMIVIVIMARTKQQEQQKSIGLWLLIPRLCTSPSWFCVLYSNFEMKLVNPKAFMFPFGPQLHIPYTIFSSRFISREVPLGIIISGFLLLVNQFVTTAAYIILRHMLLKSLWPSLYF